MAEINRAGRPFDRWPFESVPGLVEPRPRERQVLDRSRRFESWPGSSTVPTGNADEINIDTVDEPSGYFERRYSGTAGHVVPALFQCEGDAQRI